MENIDFVLWVCLLPVSVELTKYLEAKRKGIVDRSNSDYWLLYFGIALILAFN